MGWGRPSAEGSPAGKAVLYVSVPVDGVEAAVATAQEPTGDRIVEVAAGDVGGQVLAAGLVDEVRTDVVPVVFGGPAGASSGRSTRSTCWTIQTW